MQARRSPGAVEVQPPRAKPLKRPAQARAKFTVQAIYDAFIRIWQRDGWTRLTTRAVALETGVSVGTLYEYFPNKQALLSGYMRHAIEKLAEAVAQRPTTLDRTVRLICDPRTEGLPPVDARMIDLEHEFAEPKHHHRAYVELLAAWRDALVASGCEGDPALIETLFLAAWGGRRAILRVQAPIPIEDWVVHMQAVCAASLKRQPAGR